MIALAVAGGHALSPSRKTAAPKAAPPRPAARKSKAKASAKAAAEPKAKTRSKAKAPAGRGARPATAKKAVAKKSSAKKPAAKKTVAKKTAGKSPRAKKAGAGSHSPLLTRILAALDADKAENIVTVDLRGRSALCDAAVIASGRSSRHVAAIAEHLARRLKEAGYGTSPVSGAAQGDWVLVDAGDVIVHLFRPEVREYYDLEGMWSVSPRK